MLKSIAYVATDHASKYLQQLCKHWSHKLQVAFTPEHGTVRFDAATLTLDAEPATLVATLESADRQSLNRLETVVADHLKRFAFREELTFRWTQPVE